MRRLSLLLLIAFVASAQQPDAPATAKELRQLAEDNDRNFEIAVKQTNDVLWYFKTGDVAQIDKVLYTSKPGRRSLQRSRKRCTASPTNRSSSSSTRTTTAITPAGTRSSDVRRRSSRRRMSASGC